MSVKSGGNAFLNNGSLNIKDTTGLVKNFNGKSTDEIAKILKDAGYDVTIRQSSISKSGAEIIQINNPGGGRNITQVQVSPGGGRHGSLPYVKISTSDNGIVKILNGSEDLYISDGLEKSINIFSGGDGN